MIILSFSERSNYISTMMATLIFSQEACHM